MMPERTIFVFGSNLAGVHGAGSAKRAFLNHGAVWGRGVGLNGDSYAIPTKDEQLRTLPLHRIGRYVGLFLELARARPNWTFCVVAIGCGLAGYKPYQIAPMFKGAPGNVCLPLEFYELLHA
jgi:hypothetical protein